jgi:hypothetical protein
VDSGQWIADSGHWAVEGGQWTVGSGQWAVDCGQWTVGSKQWTVKTVDSAQWTVNSGQFAVNSGQWTVDSGQWAVGSEQCTVGSGQWTFRFCLAEFGSFTKYSQYFASNIRLQRKFVSGPNLFRMSNLLIRFDAKQANKTILFASKRINIRSIFAYICFEPNMSGAPYSLLSLFSIMPVSEHLHIGY